MAGWVNSLEVGGALIQPQPRQFSGAIALPFLTLQVQRAAAGGGGGAGAAAPG